MPNPEAPVVLVVDDVDMNVMILEEILRDDYNLLTAGNGKKALEILDKAEVLPKIILLDVQMPEMTGRELFDIIKVDERFNRIPVIFITAENDSEIELLAAGASDFINKPFTPEIVKLRVRHQIKLKNYSDSLEEMVARKTAEVIKKTEEANNILNNALLGLANAIEYRDHDSGEHVKRTQLYLGALVESLIKYGSIYAMELAMLQPEIIFKSMALHDVGKIAIPDSILCSKNRLTREEFEIMKTHTTKGKQIIGELGDPNSSLFLKHCEDICYGHHERWDGTGYPRGIKCENIPIVARLAALADVYDALVFPRVYKAAVPYDDAIRIIIDGKGSQFDPIMCDTFIGIRDELKNIAQNHS